jgi:hypothetical protein
MRILSLRTVYSGGAAGVVTWLDDVDLMYFNVPEVICYISRDDVVKAVKGMLKRWWAKGSRMKVKVEGCDKAGREVLAHVVKHIGFECE